ncbi:MAG: hypothetical protein ACTSU2_02930, partial [Promethearchaeota archaeon]
AELEEKFIFYRSNAMTKKIEGINENHRISLVNLPYTLEELKLISLKLFKLKNNDILLDQTPFISVDGDPEDIGVWWSFKLKNNQFFITIERRLSDSIKIRTDIHTLADCFIQFSLITTNLLNFLDKDDDLAFNKLKEQTLLKAFDLLTVCRDLKNI